MQLISAQVRAGGSWSVENPDTSLLWSYGPVAALLRDGFDVQFDHVLMVLEFLEKMVLRS